MDVGKRIARLRLRAGLTQAELARLASVDQQNLSKIERGAIVPRLDTAMKIARSLRVSLSRMVGERETRRVAP